MTLNGMTWDEELLSRIREASEHQKLAQRINKQAVRDVEYWGEYIKSLQHTLELYRRGRAVKTNGHEINAERLQKQSTWANLLDITSSSNGVLVVVDATTILVEAEIFQDREHARNVIYSTLYSHKKDVEKIREGVYQLHKRINGTKDTTKIIKKRPKKQRVISGLRQVVKDLKERNPQMTRSQVQNHLLDTGFDFKGKKPGNAVNMTWIYWGYNKEGKQQSLPGVN